MEIQAACRARLLEMGVIVGEGYQKAINAGVMTPNEAREREGLQPMDGGEVLLVNSTMVPISQAGQRTQTTSPPASLVMSHAPAELDEIVKTLGAATGETFVRVEESMRKHSETMENVADSLRDLATDLRLPRKRSLSVTRDESGRVSTIQDSEE